MLLAPSVTSFGATALQTCIRVTGMFTDIRYGTEAIAVHLDPLAGKLNRTGFVGGTSS
jgi:hypothetical protein